MRKKMVQKILCVCFVLGVIGISALAYFTTYAQTSGEWEIQLDYKTKLVEVVEGYVKHVRVESEDPSCDVFVRVRAFSPDDYSLAYDSDIPETWSEGADGWYYYSSAVPSGGSTSTLDVEICDEAGNQVQPTTKEQKFNVVVVHEATPALHTEQGEAYPDWTQKVNGYEALGV